MSSSDEILQTLAFQRGVLTLLRDTSTLTANIERAIERIDSLIDRFSIAQLFQRVEIERVGEELG